MAGFITSYSNFFVSHDHLREAESLLSESINLYKKYEVQYSDTVRPIKLRLLLMLSSLYGANKDPSQLGCLKEAINLLQEAIKSNNKNLYNKTLHAQLLGNLSYCYLFERSYIEAERVAQEGLAIDATQHWIVTNYAAALLFQGKYTEAMNIYQQYKSVLKDDFLNDFEQFAESGVIPKEYEAEVDRIKKMLNE